MARPSGSGAHPYVVRGRYRWRDEPVQEWDCSAHAKLSTALNVAWAVEVAWLRLVGGQRQPLSWHVIDIRDFVEYRRGTAVEKGETNGTDESGRPYARRDHRTDRERPGGFVHSGRRGRGRAAG